MNYLSKLHYDKIKINWNKNPVKMKDFMSFLKVSVEKTTNHLGYANGWTRYHGENNLIITGGWVGGIEYLDALQYKKNLDNPYNNYVNPFYIWDILTEEGHKFFLNYYKEDFLKILETQNCKIESAEKKLESLNKELDEMDDFFFNIGFRY